MIICFDISTLLILYSNYELEESRSRQTWPCKVNKMIVGKRVGPLFFSDQNDLATAIVSASAEHMERKPYLFNLSLCVDPIQWIQWIQLISSGYPADNLSLVHSEIGSEGAFSEHLVGESAA